MAEPAAVMANTLAMHNRGEFETTYTNASASQALVRSLTSSLARIMASQLSGITGPRTRGR
jgi:hypothetical protein